MRVAIIGLGVAARKILLPAVRADSRLELVAATDADAAARERAARDGIGTVYDSAEEAIDRAKPELVIIATPPDAHKELCVRALEAGAHVFCEKPFVPSVTDAEAVIGAASRTGRQVAVNNQYFKMPIFERAREAIARGAIGRPLFLSAWQTTLEPPARHTGWRGALRRRTLFEFGNHAVDLILYLLDARPAAVTCQVSSDGGEREWDAFASAVLRFEDGRMASLVTDRVSRGRWRYLDMRVEGTEGTLRVSLGGEARLALGVDGLARVPFLSMQLTRGGFAWIERGERRTIIARNPPEPYTWASCRHLAAFVDAALAGRPYERGAIGNKSVIETIAAAYLSADLKRTVDLKTDRDEIARQRLG